MRMTFDIGIFKLITTWLIFRTIDGYEISTEHVTWGEIDNVCKQHFLPEVFTNEVKDSLTKLLPYNEKIWLHAKSRPTNYLIWKGCHKLQFGKRVISKKLKNNSISGCIRKTNCTVGSRIALKRDTCVCEKRQNKPKGFTGLPFNVSDHTCQWNLNKDCGCPDELFSVYLLSYSHKQCVAVVKDNSGELQLTENNCSSTFRAVCKTSSRCTETKFPVLVVIIAAVGGVVVLCVVILGIVCWKRRNRGRKRSPTVNNRFYDQVVCSNVPNKKPAQPKPGQDSNQGECSYAYQSVDPVGVNNTTSNEGHYDVAFIHSNNTHTLPLASGNIYDRCYGKSTGTPMDRNTYDNAESGHSFSASKDADHYDTTRNVQPKSGAKICSEGDYDTVTNTSSCNRDA